MQLNLLWPEISLAALVLIILVIGLINHRVGNLYAHAVASLGLIGILACTWAHYGQYAVLFGGTYLIDDLSWFFKVLFLVAAVLVVMSSRRYNDASMKNHWQFPALLLSAVIGMMVMVSGGDLVVIYIGLEMMTVTFYILAAYLDADLRSYEAGLKYLVLGALSSAVFLLGLSFVYAVAGTTNLQEISLQAVTSKLLLLALALVVAGMGFKISAVPFHMWAPDVYEGAPTPVTALLAVASKAAGFAVLVRILIEVFANFTGSYTLLLAIIAAVTILLGNLVAIPQKNMKRLLAYSSIAQAGYILVGVVANNGNGLKGVFFYALVYVFANLGAFIVLTRTESEVGSSDIEALAGLSRRSPLMAAVMTICLLSLAGIPPLAGFVGKWYLFSGAIQGGYTWLALIGLIMSMVSVYYYLSVVLKMYIGKPVSESAISLNFGEALAIWVCFLLTLAAGVYPAPVAAMAKMAWLAIAG